MSKTAKAAKTDNTDEKLSKPWLFKQGDDPRRNEKGRPKGSKNALAESFVSALYEDFTKAVDDGGAVQGAIAISKFRDEDPGGYVRAIASIMPKEMIFKNEMDDVSDEQLAAFLDAARAALGIHEEGSSGVEPATSKKQVKALRPVHETN